MSCWVQEKVARATSVFTIGLWDLGLLTLRVEDSDTAWFVKMSQEDSSATTKPESNQSSGESFLGAY
jgi:hypothetical protein